MEFLGSIFNVIVLLCVVFYARDWLLGLRADTQETRDTVLALRKDLAEFRKNQTEISIALLDAQGRNAKAFEEILDQLSEIAGNQITREQVADATASAIREAS